MALARAVAVLVAAFVATATAIRAQNPTTDHPAYAPLAKDEEATIQTGAATAAAKKDTDRSAADLELLAAQQFLTRRADHDAKIADLAKQIADAPAQLDEIRAELAKPAESGEPQIPPQATLAELEQSLRQAETELTAATQRLDEAKTVGDARSARRQEIPNALVAARARVAAIEALLAAGVDPDAHEPLAPERKLRLRAERMALIAEAAALERELTMLDAIKELVTARRDRAARRLDVAKRGRDALASIAETRRREQAERDRLDAERIAQETAESIPEIRALAAELEELTKRRSDPQGASAVLASEQQRLAETEADIADLRRRYRDVSETLSRIGSGGEAGAALLREWQDAGRVGASWREIRSLTERLGDAELTEFNLRSRQDRLSDAGTDVSAIASAHPNHPQLASIELQARDLIVKRNGLVDALVDEWTSLADVRGRLLAATKLLRDAADEYRGFIGGKIFGVRSVATRDAFAPAAVLAAGRYIGDFRAWTKVGEVALAELMSRLLEDGSLLLLAILGLVLRRKARDRFAALAQGVGRYSTDSFMLTLRATLLTILAAFPLPLCIVAVGVILNAAGSAMPDQGSALGRACRNIAIVTLCLQLALGVVRKRGLADAHFRWPADAVVRIRKLLRAFASMFLPAFVVHTMLQQQADAAHRDGLGRIALIVQLIAIAVMLGSLLHTNGPIVRILRARAPGSVIERFAFGRFLFGVGFPLGLALLDVAGYDYTAQVMGACLLGTIAIGFAALVVYGLLLRWLHVARVRIAVEQARKRREQLAREAAEGGGSTPEPAATIDEDAVDLPAVNEQSMRLFRSGLLLTLIVVMLAVWSGVLPAFRTLDRVQLWPKVMLLDDERFEPHALVQDPTPNSRPADVTADATPASAPATASGQTSSASPLSRLSPGTATASESLAAITLADVARALFALVLMFVLVRNVPALLEILLRQLTDFDSGARYAAITLLRHTITIVGTVVAFGLIGIGWGQLQWLAAAFTFGIAFGLQEIFANFISGLIVLLERPMRVGDLVTVNGQTGVVARLRMRATTILDSDRREIIIPNKALITTDVVNWTLSDSITRAVVKIGVAYGTDTRKAKRLLLEAARAERLVMAEPPPQAIMVGFGESTLQLELRVYLARRDLWPELIDALHEGIAQAFAREHIEIAFPQLDVNINGIHRDAPPTAGDPHDPAR